ncbi:MAG: hypothetical protein JXK05_08190 [Campylobacterales bacterium]|nr:hypothetical protein [Campylobacterales bacterium]
MKRQIALAVFAAGILSAAPEIELDPVIENFVPENRIILKANIQDEKAPQLTRTYFKSSDVSDYVFVPMKCESSQCHSVLPATSKDTLSIDYLILVVDANKKVYKTQTFTAQASQENNLPSYQSADKSGTIDVKTELSKAPKAITGFTDSYVVDTIESAARFGVVAGIYSHMQGMGSGTSTATTSGESAAVTATGATSGGTVAATAAGLGTTAWIVGGVVATGAVAGLAAGSGGGGGGGDSGSHSSAAEVITSQTSASKFVGTYDVTDPSNNSITWVTTLNKNGSCHEKEYFSGTYHDEYDCTWSFDSGTLTIVYEVGPWSGTPSGTTDNFTLSGYYNSGKYASNHFVKR